MSKRAKSKPEKKRTAVLPAPPVSAATTAKQTAANPKGAKADPGSKQSRVITMLEAPTGATIATIMKATGWQPHSVRGFLAGVVRKRLKLKLTSKEVDGNRIYQITNGDRGKSGTREAKRQSA
jgi:hypothetical protein